MENSNVPVFKKSMTSIDDLLKKSWEAYKIVVFQYVKMSLFGVVALIPTGIIVVLMLIFGDQIDEGTTRMVLYIVLGIIGTVALVSGIIISYIAQVALQVIVYKKDASLKLKEAFKIAKGKALDFLTTNLLAGIIIMLGFIVFIVPGIIWSIYYYFVVWIVLKEDKFGMKALRRSKSLVKGYWWSVVGRSLLITILMFFVYGVLNIPTFFMEEESMIAILYNMSMQIVQWFIAPFPVAYSYYMYKSLVSIKDGQDHKESAEKLEASQVS